MDKRRNSENKNKQTKQQLIKNTNERTMKEQMKIDEQTIKSKGEMIDWRNL